jgi:VWFA-related protein
MKSVAAFAVAVAASFGAGVQDAPRQPQAFRSGTTLVEFTVVALDNRGKPVTDLTKEEFGVSDLGKPREIAFFKFDGAPENRRPEPLPDGVFTNRAEYAPGAPHNVTAIVLDALHTTPITQSSVRRQLLRYLDGLPPESQVAVYQLGQRLTIVHDFTADLASIRARLASLEGEVPPHAAPDDVASGGSGLTPDAAEMLSAALADMRRQEEGYQEHVEDRMRAQALALLEELGSRLAGMPGRKNLVWITVGMPILTFSQAFLSVHEKQFRATAERLANQGVAIYPVDARGLVTPATFVSSTGRGSSRGGAPAPTQAGLPDQRVWATMDVMAEVTGGRVSKNTNDMAEGVRAAANDLRGAYTIGFYGGDESDNAWHAIDVKVKRRGVRLSHRQGYRAAKPEALTDWSEPQWRWAVANPLGSTGIHLDARLDPVVGAEPHTYGLLLLIPPDELHFARAGSTRTANVEIVVAEKNASGGFAFQVGATPFTLPEGTETAGSVLRYRDQWKVRTDTASIRVIVRDRATGRHGTLDIPIAKRSSVETTLPEAQRSRAAVGEQPEVRGCCDVRDAPENPVADGNRHDGVVQHDEPDQNEFLPFRNAYGRRQVIHAGTAEEQRQEHVVFAGHGKQADEHDDRRDERQAVVTRKSHRPESLV